MRLASVLSPFHRFLLQKTCSSGSWPSPATPSRRASRGKRTALLLGSECLTFPSPRPSKKRPGPAPPIEPSCLWSPVANLTVFLACPSPGRQGHRSPQQLSLGTWAAGAGRGCCHGNRRGPSEMGFLIGTPQPSSLLSSSLFHPLLSFLLGYRTRGSESAGPQAGLRADGWSMGTGAEGAWGRVPGQARQTPGGREQRLLCV